jgi:hypothetical protein
MEFECGRPRPREKRQRGRRRSTFPATNRPCHWPSNRRLRARRATDPNLNAEYLWSAVSRDRFENGDMSPQSLVFYKSVRRLTLLRARLRRGKSSSCLSSWEPADCRLRFQKSAINLFPLVGCVLAAQRARDLNAELAENAKCSNDQSCPRSAPLLRARIPVQVRAPTCGQTDASDQKPETISRRGFRRFRVPLSETIRG